jgi:hypothetical protein
VSSTITSSQMTKAGDKPISYPLDFPRTAALAQRQTALLPPTEAADEGCKAVFSMSLCYWLAGGMIADFSITGNLSAAINTNYRNQRQTQRVKPTQQTLQSSLIDGAGQGGDRWAITLAADRDRHPPDPIRPTLTELSRHFDLVGCWSIQGELHSAHTIAFTSIRSRTP